MSLLFFFLFLNVYPLQFPRDTQVPELQSKKRSLLLYVEKITVNLKLEWNTIIVIGVASFWLSVP